MIAILLLTLGMPVAYFVSILIGIIMFASGLALGFLAIFIFEDSIKKV
jgi:hypothetical protein